MKELSIEQKAKAYDEAIKRAKDFMNGEAHYELKIGENIMCWVFPELRESEDERMRAMAIKAVHSPEAQSCIKSWGINPDDVIAWLEKQSEQKPAEWSEEDEENLKWFEKFFRAESVIAEGKDIPQDRYLWFKNLKGRVQPKQEWSEDTQQWIDVIIKDYEDLHDANKDHRATIQAKINILKSLRPQSQWRPSEEMLEALYRAIPENTMAISEDEMLLDKLYQGLKYGRVLSNK